MDDSATRVAHVKVCGLTDRDDARACVSLGVSSIGLNFVAGSARRIDVQTARAIVAAVGGRVVIVGVVACLHRHGREAAGREPPMTPQEIDAHVEALERLRDDLGLSCLQLHGDEPPELVARLLPHAYKAVRIADESDVQQALRYPGHHLLVDAKVTGALGGTGVRAPVDLVAPLARSRKLTLAGGLTPENVAEAIAAVKPFCVDVASGVEAPGVAGRKDLARVERFIAAAMATRF